ncbi:MAG: GGDEF domain-containing protein, partial [Eggerthellaceae bacterium]|nr:GGDEF domain-containing protein [Eggerthellaceae bacterium]
ALEGDCDSPIGVVYADLNGLKTVNDKEGHNAGDLLLKNGAKALLKAFTADEVFRAGGDEFVVIVPGISQDELAHRVETVRQAAHDADGVEFAIGYCVASDGAAIRAALIEADARMYEDKRAYYDAHPEKDRRAR